MKRDVFNASGSGVKHGYTHRVSTSAKGARCKNSVNIEEMIADEGFGFHAEVKVIFLKPEKVNRLIFLWKQMQARSPTDRFYFIFYFIFKSLSLLFLTLRLSFIFLFLNVC